MNQLQISIMLYLSLNTKLRYNFYFKV